MSKERMSLVNPRTGKLQICAKFTDVDGKEKVKYVKGVPGEKGIVTVEASTVIVNKCK